jgi:hypothetical protein
MSGVTDALIRSARCAAEGDAQTFLSSERTLLDQHFAAIEQAVSDPATRQELRERTQNALQGFVDLCTSIRASAK